MDDVDRAQMREQENRQDALAAQQRRAHPDDAPEESARWCIDCGEPIPEARRLAVPGCSRCVDCQQFAEDYGP